MTLPSIETFERAGLKAWPGIEVEWDGAWVRRSANGYTKRANSLQCFDPADGGDAAQRLDRARDWFTARGLPLVVRTTPLENAALTETLDAQGWTTIEKSHLYAMALSRTEPDAEGQVLDLLDPAFLSAQQRLQGHDETTMNRMRALLSVMAVPAAGIVIFRDKVPVASGLMAIAESIVIAGNVIVDADRRRQGLGAALMRTGLAWAHDNGATIAALNVNGANAAACTLYGSLGYAHQYDYVYRIPKDAR